MAEIVVLNAEFGEQGCELPDGKYAVGRAQRNAIIISHSSVSSEHCELMVEGPEVIVHDCGSRNGTFVNDSRVQTQCQVKHGQRIRLGQVEMRLDLGDGKSDSDASEVTAIYSLRSADRARPLPSNSFPVTFTPYGERLPESATMYVPKVRTEPPPTFSIPEVQVAARKRSLPLMIALIAGVIVAVAVLLIR